MAAPTAVSTEALSMSSTILRWTYSGTAYIAVYRSTDGVSYSEATVAATRVATGTTEYTDTGLTAGTKYWYKLTDDLGSTFSSVVTVYTHFCADQNNAQAFQLPRFDEGQEDQSAQLNALAERVERALGDSVFDESTCVVCPDDGAVVVDCTNGCNRFVVVADQDINSFSINRCGELDPPIEVYVPPSTTVSLCGFPAGYGWGGNECNEAPISGGTTGRTVNVGRGGGGDKGSSKPGAPKTKQSAGAGSGGGSGGTRCECVPTRKGELTLKCCTANCSLGCTTTTKTLLLKVCGGVGPYTFSHTGSVKFRKNVIDTPTDTHTSDHNEANPQIVVTVPANTGSAVAGIAYHTCLKYKCSNIGTCSTCWLCFPFKCDDTEDSSGASGADCSSAPSVSCSGGAGNLTNCSQLTCATCQVPEPATFCNGAASQCSGSCQAANLTCTICTGNTSIAWTSHGGDFLCDVRTAGMISNGCSPCGLNQGSVVTVTDAAGVSVSITLKK